MPAKSFAESLQNILQIVLNLFGIFLQKHLTISAQTIFIFHTMKHLRFFKMTVALVASLLSAQSTFAQGTITSFEAEPQMLRPVLPLTMPRYLVSYIRTSGSFGEGSHRLLNSTISAQIDLNEADTSVTFRRVEIDIQDLELSGDFVVGDGFGGTRVTNTISGTIDFDPIVFTGDEALTTTLQPDGHFLINNLGRSWSGATSVSGSYKFSGPTETKSGTFQTNTGGDIQRSASVDTMNYPNEVVVSGNPNYSTMPLPSINEIIDGVNVSVRIGWSELDAPDDWEFQNTQIIPEPSEYAFLVGVCLIAFVAFRRRGFVKSV